MKHPPGVVALVAGFIALAVFFAILERAAAAIPRKPLFRRDRAVDFAYWFVTPWLSHTLSLIAVAVFVAAVAFSVREAGSSVPSPAWFISQPKAAQIVELLVAADLLGYIAHRIFHGRALWRFHAIHHSSENLDWLSATRVHPLNEVGNRLFQIIPLYVLGFRGEALAAVVPILTFWSIFIHANIRWDFGVLRYVVATPVFHRWHHTSEAEGLERNFAGLFPWIDVLFGTFYMPWGVQPARFGVIGERVPPDLVEQLLYPFMRPQRPASPPDA
jgi:sterol desaturase/sphingolipid hydroxylase (fatty acid hydroxylase superfamily)